MRIRTRNRNRNAGVTLIELLISITIIGILAGIGFGLYSAILKSSKRKTASTQIRLIEVKLNDFKLEHGFLPPATFVTGTPPADINTPGEYNPDPTTDEYLRASRVLFLALTGKATFNSSETPLGKVYLEPTKNMVGAPDEAASTTSGDPPDPILRKTYTEHTFDSGSYFIDPWGNPYGYYFNPENDEWRAFMSPSSPDVWSTGSHTDSEPGSRVRWIVSWKPEG